MRLAANRARPAVGGVELDPGRDVPKYERIASTVALERGREVSMTDMGSGRGRARLVTCWLGAIGAGATLLVVGAPGAAAAPLGQITEFSSGLGMSSDPDDGIAPGPDGNVWFTDEGN